MASETHDRDHAPEEFYTPPSEPSTSLWFGVLLTAAAWGLQLQIGYALGPGMCNHGATIWFYVVTGVCLALAILGGVLSYGAYLGVGKGSPDGTGGDRMSRERFLGAVGVASSVLFSLAIVWQFLPRLFFDPCWA